jgi:protein arginine kinase activator
MLCQECGKRPATLHFTKIVNGEKTESHFCEACAREKGDMIPGTANGFSIHHLLSGLMDFEPGGGASPAAKKSAQSLHCENCGMTYAQFSKLGKFGCSRCYKHFADRLDPLFRRVHGTAKHAGKIPKRSGGQVHYKREIEHLKRELQWLVEKEEFEQAAKIRDRIRDLEKKISGAS